MKEKLNPAIGAERNYVPKPAQSNPVD